MGRLAGEGGDVFEGAAMRRGAVRVVEVAYGCCARACTAAWRTDEMLCVSESLGDVCGCGRIVETGVGASLLLGGAIIRVHAGPDVTGAEIVFVYFIDFVVGDGELVRAAREDVVAIWTGDGACANARSVSETACDRRLSLVSQLRDCRRGWETGRGTIVQAEIIERVDIVFVGI